MNKMKERLQAVLRKARDISAKAENEGREFSPTERAEIEGLGTRPLNG